MGALTETEIFACLAENLTLAAEECERLAVLPAAGPTYNSLRHRLRLIEGACRQASAWREDTRWLPIGLMMHEAHDRAGNWLRGFHPRKLFLKLAENLRALAHIADDLRTKATGTVGMILPDPLSSPIRTQDRPVQVALPGDPQTKPGFVSAAPAPRTHDNLPATALRPNSRLPGLILPT